MANCSQKALGTSMMIMGSNDDDDDDDDGLGVESFLTTCTEHFSEN